MPLSFLTAPCQDRGSFYCCSWDVTIVFQYTKTRCPDGPCVSPRTAPSRTTEGFLAIVTRAAITGHSLSMEAGGGGWSLYGCFEKMCEIGVWVLRVLAQLGVYCAEGWAPYWHPWSPPLTQKLCSAPCVFFVNLFLTTPSHSLTFSSLVSLNLPSSAPLSLWVRAKESEESSSLLSELTGFILMRLMAVNGDHHRVNCCYIYKYIYIL